MRETIEEKIALLAPEPARELTGKPLSAGGIAAQIIPVERVVEEIGRIVAGIAVNACGVDQEPAARAVKHVLVVEIAMQGTQVALVRDELAHTVRGIREECLATVLPIMVSAGEEAAEMLIEGSQSLRGVKV